MKKILIPIFVILLLVSTALAANVGVPGGNIEHNYFYDENDNLIDATVLLYECNNNDCTQLVQKIDQGTDSHVDILLPYSKNPKDYAVYSFVPSYPSIEWVFNDNWGSGYNYGTYLNHFEKLSDCRAPLSDFSLNYYNKTLKQVEVGQPITINVSTELSGDVVSAFKDAGIPPYAFPQGYEDYYSALTRVHVQVRDSNSNLVFDETQDVSIFADTAKNVAFYWTPQQTGSDFTATVTSQVIDNKCSSSDEESWNDQFSVVNPDDELCFTNMGNIQFSNDFPIVNEPLTITYKRLSNYRDILGDRESIQTQVNYSIVNDATGQEVFSQTETLASSQDVDTQTTENFTWTPASEGDYTMTITGLGQDSSCNGIQNDPRIISQSKHINPPPYHNLNITVLDENTQAAIEDVQVTINSTTKTTNAEGKVDFELLAGDYHYESTHPDYITDTGTISMGNVDLNYHILMDHKNWAPVTTSIGSKQFTRNVQDTSLDLDDYVSDQNNAHSELTWTASYTNKLDIIINDHTHIVTIFPLNLGTGSVNFTVEDPEGASATTQMTFQVNSDMQPPVLDITEDIQLDEDTQLMDALHLPDYATDTESDPEDMTYTIINITGDSTLAENKCGVSIDQFNNIDINPDANFNGLCHVQIQVKDSTDLTDEDTFDVIINPVNDAPVAFFIYEPQNPVVNEEITFDASPSYDIENDPLAYTWDFGDNSQANGEIVTHAYSSDGIYNATLTVSDGQETSSITIPITVIFIGDLEIKSIQCFPYVVENHNQSCSVYIEANNEPISNANVNIYYSDETQFASCTTDSITGACEVKDMQIETGNFTVYATASKPGYRTDNDTYPRFSYQVLENRYNIQNLKIYNNSDFTQEDYDFYRNEPMWVGFEVRDSENNFALVDNIITEATLISPPGGRATLTKINSSNGKYYYELNPIPPTHYFLGNSQVFTFAFNFTDNSGGQEQVSLTIKNNPPQIIGTIPNIITGEPFSLDLSPYEFDIEDSGDNLRWTVSNVNNSIHTAEIQNHSLIINPVSEGTDTITLKLFDLNNDYDSTEIEVNITDTETLGEKTRTVILPRRAVHMSNIYFVDGDFLYPGDDFIITTNFKNNYGEELKDVHITAIALGNAENPLGVRRRIGPFNIDKEDTVIKRVILPIPYDAQPGMYNVRLTLSNDQLRRVIAERTIIIR